MKERPILFSGPMVRAILDGSKSQTRRILHEGKFGATFISHPDGVRIGDHSPVISVCPIICPYGQPGDRLWVREEHYCFGHWEDVPGAITKGGKQKTRFVHDTNEVRYDRPTRLMPGEKLPKTEPQWHKRLARFMPRKFSRTILQITNVRVERLQDITLGEIVKEGLAKSIYDFKPAQDGFRHWKDLWNSINGPESWAKNPYVWVVEFKLVKGVSHV